ncbi:MAG: methyltransferase domain-containing protein [Planctomycetota bacterium]|nr:methyltransferase domain-containing protein [Planctomycetota bacterium]
MPEPLAPEHFADWNEQMVQRYDPEVFHHHPRGVVRWVENKRIRAVIHGLVARPEHRILDVGCGAGNILAQLPGAQRHGVDLSAQMAKRAQERLGAGATVIQGDAEQLPYEDGFFDRVVATSLLSHVLHPEQVIQEIRRVTKPNGRVVISVCDEERIERGIRLTKILALDRLFFGKGEPQVYNVEYHLHRFSLPRLRDVVGGHLKELYVVGVPYVFPVHAIGVYERPA